jgi:hypothetical protein
MEPKIITVSGSEAIQYKGRTTVRPRNPAHYRQKASA